MTDADLIYNALLRAEKRLEDKADSYPKGGDMRTGVLIGLACLITLREEIGNGLSKEGR